MAVEVDETMEACGAAETSSSCGSFFFPSLDYFSFSFLECKTGGYEIMASEQLKNEQKTKFSQLDYLNSLQFSEVTGGGRRRKEPHFDCWTGSS